MLLEGIERENWPEIHQLTTAQQQEQQQQQNTYYRLLSNISRKCCKPCFDINAHSNHLQRKLVLRVIPFSKCHLCVFVRMKQMCHYWECFNNL